MDELLERFETMTLGELTEFRKRFEERFDVTADHPVVQFPPGDIPADEPPDEPTAFDVVVTSTGDQKVKVIKEVRAVTDLGLREAKALVDSLPAVILAGVSREDADAAAERVGVAGAAVDVRAHASGGVTLTET